MDPATYCCCCLLLRCCVVGVVVVAVVAGASVVVAVVVFGLFLFFGAVAFVGVVWLDRSKHCPKSTPKRTQIDPKSIKHETKN